MRSRAVVEYTVRGAIVEVCGTCPGADESGAGAARMRALWVSFNVLHAAPRSAIATCKRKGIDPGPSGQRSSPKYFWSCGSAEADGPDAELHVASARVDDAAVERSRPLHRSCGRDDASRERGPDDAEAAAAGQEATK